MSLRSKNCEVFWCTRTKNARGTSNSHRCCRGTFCLRQMGILCSVNRKFKTGTGIRIVNLCIARCSRSMCRLAFFLADSKKDMPRITQPSAREAGQIGQKLERASTDRKKKSKEPPPKIRSEKFASIYKYLACRMQWVGRGRAWKRSGR